jgi:hypothetical protein
LRGPTGDEVTAGSPRKAVVADAAEHVVVAGACADLVVPTQPEDLVGSAQTGDTVVAWRSADDVVALGAGDVACTRDGARPLPVAATVEAGVERDALLVAPVRTHQVHLAIAVAVAVEEEPGAIG